MDVRNFDLSLVKGFRFGEAAGLQFRAEFFNLFNHANFGLPNHVSVARPGAGNGPGGRITDTVRKFR